MFAVRDYTFNGWRIIHELKQDGKPFCGSNLKWYMWRKIENPTFADGEECERCAKARDKYEMIPTPRRRTRWGRSETGC